ncbi:MAG: hypothetical protein ABWY57_16440, partial [Mycetocola sp.]
MTVIDEKPPEAVKPVARRILPPPVTGQELVLIGVIAVLWALLGIFTPSFLSPASIQPLLVSVAPLALIGVGMTFIIITAGIDVSVGGAIALCAVVTAKLLVNFDVPLIVAVATSMLLGLLLGLINGALIAYGRVHAIIITFGTANI